MFTWKDFQIQTDRRMEERKQAKRQRLIQSTMGFRQDVFLRMRVTAGKRLVVWGTRLQKHCRGMAVIGPELTKELLDTRSASI